MQPHVKTNQVFFFLKGKLLANQQASWVSPNPSEFSAVLQLTLPQGQEVLVLMMSPISMWKVPCFRSNQDTYIFLSNKNHKLVKNTMFLLQKFKYTTFETGILVTLFLEPLKLHQLMGVFFLWQNMLILLAKRETNDVLCFVACGTLR